MSEEKKGTQEELDNAKESNLNRLKRLANEHKAAIYAKQSVSQEGALIGLEPSPFVSLLITFDSKIFMDVDLPKNDPLIPNLLTVAFNSFKSINYDKELTIKLKVKGNYNA